MCPPPPEAHRVFVSITDLKLEKTHSHPLHVLWTSDALRDRWPTWCSEEVHVGFTLKHLSMWQMGNTWNTGAKGQEGSEQVWQTTQLQGNPSVFVCQIREQASWVSPGNPFSVSARHHMWPPLSLSAQTATLFWGTPRCSRSTPSSTAPMASASWPGTLGRSSCRRAAPATSCSAQKPAMAARLRSRRPWMRGGSSRPSWSSTRRKVGTSVLWLICIVVSLEVWGQNPPWKADAAMTTSATEEQGCSPALLSIYLCFSRRSTFFQYVHYSW